MFNRGEEKWEIEKWDWEMKEDEIGRCDNWDVMYVWFYISLLVLVPFLCFSHFPHLNFISKNTIILNLKNRTITVGEDYSHLLSKSLWKEK